MFRLIWIVSIHVHEFLQRFAPTNRLIAAVRSRRGLKWGVPAMLLAVPYLLIANMLLTLTHEGAPGWLHLVVLLCLWNAIKMLLLGPISLVWLIFMRSSESAERRRAPVEEGAFTRAQAPNEITRT